MNSPAEPPVFPGLVVGAYAASTAHRVWDPAAELELFTGLADNPDVGALELPWMGAIHPHDEAWLHRRLPARLGAVLTGIPFVMGRLGQNPGYGLASGDEEGRRAALSDVARLFDDARRLDDAQGRAAVGVVELHSAPRGPQADADALAASLAEVAGWQWGGTRLVLEHCDAWRPGLTPEKGFLSIEDELDAIERSGAAVGVSLNWARSAIEGRSADEPVLHARAAAARGLLHGVIASGVAPVQSPFGTPWIDAHLPFAAGADTRHGCAESIMTEAALAETLAAAGPLQWAGVKVGCVDPAATVADRLALIAESAATTKRLLAAVPAPV